MKNFRIWAIVILSAVMFFVALFITISTENPLSFLVYIAILTAVFVIFLFMKLTDCIKILVNGRIAIGRIVEHNFGGKGQNFATVSYTASDGNEYTESVPTISFFFCPVIYEKKNPYNIIALSGFIWKILFFLASVGAFCCEIFFIVNILTR